MTVKTRKKLIEVALPLDAINKASAREKSIRHGHPSTLHLWWARRPLAAARAVIFSQMVDDPSQYVDELRGDHKLKRAAEKALKERLKLWEAAKGLAEKAAGSGLDVPEPGPEPTLDEVLADQERQRLFGIIERLVQWENSTNEDVLNEGRAEIWQSWRRTCADNAGHARAAELFDRHKLPAFHDPFAGGGALPLEAQRLGLEAYASDLNPVAVLINKAMIEIPPTFAGKPPVNPESRRDRRLIDRVWKAGEGLAADVRYYGKWMRDEAEKRIGHLYPKVEVTAEMAKERPDLRPLVGQKLTVIAWIWARTVKSPNPAFTHVDVPLASTFVLAMKPGKEAHVEPVIANGGYRFVVRAGHSANLQTAKNGTKLAGANFNCVMSGTPIVGDYIKAEGQGGHLGARLMAVVAEGDRSRVYLSPTEAMEAIAQQAEPEWKPDVEFLQQALGFRIGNYGMAKWSDLYTARQLSVLTTLCDLVQAARDRVLHDVVQNGDFIGDSKSLADGGGGPQAYADGVAVCLGLGIGRSADFWCSIATWSPQPKNELVSHAFTKQAIPITWDFAEANPFSESGGNFTQNLSFVAKCLERFGSGPRGNAVQADAGTQSVSSCKVVSTDPPYYDNIGYADLSDFFYVWLRSALKPVFPDLFSTMTVPKAEELVATPERHGGRAGAEDFFLKGMTRAMSRLSELAHPAFPVTIYYAFKQAESDQGGTASTGWETFLDAVMRAGFAVTGTWPVRTERETRSRGIGSNALASSIVLVCRPRAMNAPTVTRREFVSALKAELPQSLAHLQRGNIAPVDLAQAAIGPGMAVYTRYASVLDASGHPLPVREALTVINQTLDEALAEQEGDFDADSRWALAWFEQAGFDEGEYGVAETLSKAKNTSVQGLKDAGILDKKSPGGKVRILKPSELPADWDPATDTRLTNWEMVHHLIRTLESGGEPAAALIARKLGSKAEVARELCYRLYTICERKKRAAEALSYNSLVQSWPEIVRLARELAPGEQGALFEESEV